MLKRWLSFYFYPIMVTTNSKQNYTINRDSALLLRKLTVSKYKQKMSDFNASRKRKLHDVSIRHERDNKWTPQGVFDVYGNTVDAIRDGMTPVIDQLDKQVLQPLKMDFADIMTKTQEVFSSGIDQFDSNLGGRLAQLTLCVACGVALYYGVTKGLPALIKGVKLAVMATGRAGADLVAKLLPESNFEPQGFSAYNRFSNAMATVLAFFCFESFNPMGFLKSLTNHRRLDSIKKTFDNLSDLVMWCFDKLKCWLTGCPSTYRASSGDPEVDEWLSQVEKLMLAKVDGTLMLGLRVQELVSALLVRGQRLKYMYQCQTKDLDTIKVAIKTAISDLVEIQKELSKSAFNKTSLRIKPLTILVTGKSGVGKSAMTVPLLDAILMRTFNSATEREMFMENNMDFIYSRAAETEFWDGYYGQKAVVYDDFMQADELRVNNGLVNEAFELIRASNIYPYLLHKAHLEDKGNSYLDCRVLLCTSNCAEMKSKVINEQEALDRRFDIRARVYPKPDYCTPETASGELDKRRLMQLEGFDPDAYEIHVNDEVIGFDDLVDLCVSKYKSIGVSGESYLGEVQRRREQEFHDARSDCSEEFFPQGDLDDVVQEFTNEFDAMLVEERKLTLRDKVLAKYKVLRTKVKEATDWAKQRVNESVGKYPLLKYALLLFSAVAIAYGLYNLVSGTDMSPQGYANQKYKARMDPKTHKVLIKNINHQGVEIKEDRVDLNYRKTMRNHYAIYCNGKFRQYMLFTHDRCAIMNAHCYDGLVDADVDIQIMSFEDHVRKTASGEKVSTRRITSDMLQRAHVIRCGSDVVSVDFDSCRHIKQHKDIRNLMLTAEEASLMSNNPRIRLYTFSAEGSKVSSQDVMARRSNVCYPPFGKFEAFTYPIKTTVGHCGSLAFSPDTCSSYGKILFFHTAGNGNSGAGLVIPPDLLRLTTTDAPNFKPQGDFDAEVLESIKQGVATHSLCGLPIVDIVADPPHLVRETKLRKSVLHGWCGPAKKAPAVLKPRGGVDPYLDTLCKYATEDPLVDTELVQTCAYSYSDELKKFPFVDKKILTFEEAVAGVPGRQYIDGIPRKTGAGYPWSLKYKNGKQEIFGSEGDYKFDTPGAREVRKTVEEKLALLKEGIRPQFYYTDTLKDELRSKKKVENGETRMISGSPVDLTILTRMYFGSFSAFMMENRIQNGCAVGINPMSKEWSDLAHHVIGEDNKCVAGDFTGFDSSQSSVITTSILDIINDWYNDGNDHIRSLLWLEVVNSLHIHGKYVVVFDHCLPSGHVLTSIINSMFVNIAFRYCWVRQVGSRSAIDIFVEFVKLVAYGDDNLCGITDVARTYGFNFETIRYWMARLGLTYTAEDKSEEGYLFKKLSECTFLKRGFRLEDDRWYAPLDLDTILEMPMWYRHGPDVPQRQADNVDNALRELALHTAEVYKKFGAALLLAASAHGDYLPMSFQLRSQEYFMNKCFESWVEENSLGEDDSIEVPLSNVSLLDGSSDPDGETVELGFVPQSNLGPAAKLNNVRQDVPSGDGNTLTGPTYDAIGSTVEDNREVNQTTGFLQDASERTYQPFPIERIDVNAMIPPRANMDKSDVTKMLETPVLVRKFSVGSADAADSTKVSINLPFDASNNGHGTDAGQGMWLSRLNAFMGFRGTAVIEFQTNVNRFAQGRLLCHYIPGQNASTSATEIHRFNLMTKSQTPNVQINLNRDTSVRMRVPFVSAYPAYDLLRRNSTTLTTCDGQMGILYVVIYSALQGASAVDVNVWLHFEDIELMNPTYAPQGFTSDVEMGFQPQGDLSDIKKKGNNTDKELQNGVLSGPLSVASKAAGVLGMIPALSSYAGTARWFLNLAAKSAASFGYAKPSIETRLTRIVDQHNAYWLCGDGEMADIKTGLSSLNKVDVLPGFAGNDLDEMSIEYMCNRNAYRGYFTWTTSNVSGDVLMSELAGPSTYSSNGVIATVPWKTFTPFSFLAYLTYMWRADLVYTFKFVKTEFHTGRVSCELRPGSTSVPTATQASYCPREILDLKESDTFTVVIPYCGLTPFLTYDTSLGTIVMRVVNPLNAPSSVSSSIDVIFEVSAQNVQFAGVSNRIAAPVTGDNSSWRPQGDLGDIVAVREKKLTLPGLSSEKGRDEAYRFVNGEAMTSIKQLLNRMCGSRYRNSSTGFKSVIMAPFRGSGVYELAGTLTLFPFCYDYVSTLSSLFVLSRGSIRLGTSARIGNDYVASVVQSDSNANILLYSSSFNTWPNSSLPFQKDVNTGVNVLHLPHFALSHSRDCEIFFSNASSPTGFGMPQTLVAINSNSTFGGADLSFYRSAGDDFQLGFFIGVPVMNVAESAMTSL